ncbi:hypothetical protein G3495_18710 [Shewanella baltica]|uniref:hypothetical protein n=1 Tax=Shewanella baltica TaxID=62322 RepID=UPI00217E0CEC|nr:hypothetical protein [Shewanella baltica]MCS6237122.1 hypothetical protein [Shewanella baltica]MCS6272558.1 hypothetical protein [Shewanella baltica]
MSQPSHPSKKWVFSELVQHDKDVLGIVAYALYKKDKHDTASSMRSSGSGEEQIEDKIRTYHDQVASVESMQSGYRSRAQNVLKETIFKTASGLIEEKMSQLEVMLSKVEKQSIVCNELQIKLEQDSLIKIDKKVAQEKTKLRKELLAELSLASQKITKPSIPRRAFSWILGGFSGLAATVLSGIVLFGIAGLIADDKTKSSLRESLVRQLLTLGTSDVPVPVPTNIILSDSKK